MRGLQLLLRTAVHLHLSSTKYLSLPSNATGAAWQGWGTLRASQPSCPKHTQPPGASGPSHGCQVTEMASPGVGCCSGELPVVQRLQKSQFQHLLHQIHLVVLSPWYHCHHRSSFPGQVLLSYLPHVSLNWEPSRAHHSPGFGRAFLAGDFLGKPWPPCPQKGDTR